MVVKMSHAYCDDLIHRSDFFAAHE